MFEAAIFLCWACFLIKFIPLKLLKAQMGRLESNTDQVLIRPETNRQDNPPDLRLAKAKSIKRTVYRVCLLYTSPSPRDRQTRDRQKSRMPSSA